MIGARDPGCRWARWNVDHQCRRNDGQALQPGQTCFTSAQAHISELRALIADRDWSRCGLPSCDRTVAFRPTGLCSFHWLALAPHERLALAERRLSRGTAVVLIMLRDLKGRVGPDAAEVFARAITSLTDEEPQP